VNGYRLLLASIRCSTKIGSATPDSIVVILASEFGNVLPSECFLKISVVSWFFLLVICVVTNSVE
jgi:hypothetical protein